MVCWLIEIACKAKKDLKMKKAYIYYKKNKKNFRFKWVFYCSLASILGLFSFFLWPIVSGLAVLVIQTVLLRKYIRSNSYLWLLKPLFIICSVYFYTIDEVLGVVGLIVALELSFYITIKRFSYFLWSLATGIPGLIFFIIAKYLIGNYDLNTGYYYFKITIMIVNIIFFPCLTWLGQSFVLSKFLVLDENFISKYNPQILDAP